MTFVLDGALEHRDHTGGHGVLRQGDVQWMTAGHGVMHSELPHEAETAHTLQLWLNLPRRQKMIPARYVNQLGAEVPVVKLPGAEMRLYAGKLGEVASPHGSDWPMTLMDIRAEAGAELVARCAGRRSRLYPSALGRGGDRRRAGPCPRRRGRLVRAVRRSTGYDTLRLVAALDAARAALFGRRRSTSRWWRRGPFVMTSDAEITPAYDDYRAGPVRRSVTPEAGAGKREKSRKSPHPEP